jgi:hypothetical protein
MPHRQFSENARNRTGLIDSPGPSDALQLTERIKEKLRWDTRSAAKRLLMYVDAHR